MLFSYFYFYIVFRSTLLNTVDVADDSIEGSADYLESKNLFVDIHDEPFAPDNTKEPREISNCDNDITLEEALLPEPEIVVDDSEQLKCDHRTNVCAQEEFEMCEDLSKGCDACKMRRATSLNRYWKEKHSIRDSLKDSIRNILDTVENFTSSGSPKLFSKFSHPKKCVSLTELTDIKTVRTTSV